MRTLILILILMLLVGCCPVSVWDTYPPIKSSGNAVCSWSVAPGGEVVTAAHCVIEGKAGFDSDMIVADIDRAKDFAILVGEHPDGARVYTEMGDPGLGEIACYYDFRGQPNCGNVTAVTDDSVFVVMSTRMIVTGDSGSPLEMNENDGLVGVMTNRYAGYIGRAARLPL